VIRKFFPHDKNYILEEAQLSLQQPLLSYLLDYVKVEHLLRNNSLGIMDNMFRKITEHSSGDVGQLEEFYLLLSGVFRYLYYQDNQLVFPFDGLEDFARYQKQWSDAFKKWTRRFCEQESFRKAILELTVFYPEDYTPQMSGLRLSAFISKTFDLKFDRQKRILKNHVA
jgi:hypothetical protein